MVHTVEVRTEVFEAQALALMEAATDALDSASTRVRWAARPDLQQGIDRVRRELATIRSGLGSELGLYA